MMTATNIATKLNVVKTGKANKAPKGAKVKEFGKVDVIAIPTELAERMKSAKADYTRIMAYKKKALPSLREVGAVLNAYRELFGTNDKAFGQQVATTPLAVVSQQDRNELMWLDSNWDRLEELRSKGEITSYSVGVMRKQLRQIDKSIAEDKTPKGVTAKATSSKAKSAPTATVAEQRDGMAQTSVKQMSAKDYATIVAKQILESGMDQDEFLKELKAALI